jgi:hypothetical protein
VSGSVFCHLATVFVILSPTGEESPVPLRFAQGDRLIGIIKKLTKGGGVHKMTFQKRLDDIRERPIYINLRQGG